MASSASTGTDNVSKKLREESIHALEQWSLTGGSASSFAISVFLILPASSSERPFTRSVIYELEAMALPQPNVLNLTSEMIPLSWWGAVERFLFPHGLTDGFRLPIGARSVHS